MIMIGGGGISTESLDPREIARAHKEVGYRAAYCPQVSVDDQDKICEIRNAFEEENILIAEVGAWCNLVSSDEGERKKNLNYVCQQLAIADEVGALCCVDFIGSIVPSSITGCGWEPDPENLTDRGFERCVETVRNIIDQVRPKRAKFCLEFMQWLLPDSPEAYLDLIHAIDRPEFAVHVDPVNIIFTPRQYFNNGDLIRNCFKLLGPWIVSCHAKDISLRRDLALHFDEVRVGLGNLDYRTYLREIENLNKNVPLMLEHLTTDQEYAMARSHLFGLCAELGIDFK